MTMTAAQAADELDFLLEVVHNANAAHANLPATYREEIDLGASARELTKLAPFLATLSTATRQRLEALILFLRGEDEVRRRGAFGPHLRVVERDAG